MGERAGSHAINQPVGTGDQGSSLDSDMNIPAHYSHCDSEALSRPGSLGQLSNRRTAFG